MLWHSIHDQGQLSEMTQEDNIFAQKRRQIRRLVSWLLLDFGLHRGSYLTCFSSRLASKFSLFATNYLHQTPCWLMTSKSKVDLSMLIWFWSCLLYLYLINYRAKEETTSKIFGVVFSSPISSIVSNGPGSLPPALPNQNTQRASPRLCLKRCWGNCWIVGFQSYPTDHHLR